jgi:hypothetical protein
VVVNRSGPAVWQHDPGHRRGVPYHIASVQQRFGGSTQAGQRREFRWQDPVVPATRNSSLNRPEVSSANPRPNVLRMDGRSNPRRPDDQRTGRPDRRNFSANPAATRSVEPRPEFRGPVSRPPAAPVTAAPQVHAGPGNVPHGQSNAPQPVAPAKAGHGQAGNHPAPSAARAHGEGHNR